MPTESESYAPAVAAKVRVFCKGCGYALVGLSSSTCPECGRGFDLSNRRTFARRPPRGWVWRWGRRVLAVMLLLMLAAGVGIFCLWWGWHNEQGTIGRLRTLNATITLKQIGPERLNWALGKRFAYLTDRVSGASLYMRPAVEIESVDFRSLRHLETLALIHCDLNEHILEHLGELSTLRDLNLLVSRFHTRNMTFLSKLHQLEKLNLACTEIPDAGVASIAGLKRLGVLRLESTTTLTDAGLQQLKGLPALEELDVSDNYITDACLESLIRLRSLRVLRIESDSIRGRRVSRVTRDGIAKLKQARPDLRIAPPEGLRN